MEVKNRGEALVLSLCEDESKYELDLLDLRNDVIFKAFFGDRRNNNLLLDFLEAVLGESIISVELLNPYVEPAHANDKSSEMDFRVLTDQGEQINVEMQVKGHKAFKERMLIYWAKMYSGQDKISQSYENLNRAIQIVVTNFTLLAKPHYHSMFQLMDPEDGTVFSTHAEIHVLELPKLRRFQLQGSKKLEQWLLFLKSDKETKEALAMESSTMREAFEEIQRLSEDPATRAAAISREIFLKDQVQRELDAEAAGEIKGKTEVILNMHKEQHPIEVIARATNLPVDEVLSIVRLSLQ